MGRNWWTAAGTLGLSLQERPHDGLVARKRLQLGRALQLAARQLRSKRLVPGHPGHDLGHRPRVHGAEQHAGAPEGLAHRPSVVGDDGQLRAHRLDQRNAEALVLREADERVGVSVVGGQLGAFRLAAYLRPYLTHIYPNLLFTGAIFFSLVALTPREPSDDLDRFAARGRPPKLALVAGTEGAGLTPDAESAADVRVRIPISDAVDSLNLAVAVGIALFKVQGSGFTVQGSANSER